MYNLACIVGISLVSGLAAAELSEKFAKRLESADAAYNAAVQKADNTRFYAVQKASQDRTKILKTVLTDATKAGDFDAATEIKNRLAAAESGGGVRPKPKNTVKAGGHEYALIEDKVTWHVAKRLCEAMGGHLAILETPQEEQFILKICREAKIDVWVGATDEEVEDVWRWVDGTPAKVNDVAFDNDRGMEHHLHYSHETNRFNDTLSGRRTAYIVEFDK